MGFGVWGFAITGVLGLGFRVHNHALNSQPSTLCRCLRWGREARGRLQAWKSSLGALGTSSHLTLSFRREGGVVRERCLRLFWGTRCIIRSPHILVLDWTWKYLRLISLSTRSRCVTLPTLSNWCSRHTLNPTLRPPQTGVPVRTHHITVPVLCYISFQINTQSCSPLVLHIFLFRSS